MNESTLFAWIRFVRQSGEEGKRWAEEYDRNWPITRLCQESVSVLQRRKYEEGEGLLQRAREALAALDGSTEPSLRSVMERWYLGALGFYFYSRRAFDEADCTMARAHGTIAAAIARRDWLVPLAMDCYEFELHRARIARDRQDWARMRERADNAREMRAGRTPLCVLPGGARIWMADVQRFYRSVPDVSAEDRAAVETFLDDEQNRLNAESSRWYVFRLPGFVIQYP